MTNKIPQTKPELDAHLLEQISFLEISATSFDNGFEGEAKRLATSLRILLHDSRTSISLLGQLGKKNIQFRNTASEYNPDNLMTQNCLTFIRVDSTGAKYFPYLDHFPERKIKKLDFEKWWEAIVFVDNQRNKMSRKAIVLSVADQDGGAHVDPTIDEVYSRLSRHNSLGWRFSNENSNGPQPLPGPHFACVRQITYEVLKTLKYEFFEKKHHLRH